MGEDVAPRNFTREDRQRYRTKVHRSLDAFAHMLAQSRFDFDHAMTGMEVELNLVSDDGTPTMRNKEVLAHIDNRPLIDAGLRQDVYDPAVITTAFVDRWAEFQRAPGHRAILMSATLQPYKEFAESCGLDTPRPAGHPSPEGILS